MGEFYTDYLFARPSFWEGVARIFDFAGTLNTYNTVDNPNLADYIALANDWAMIAQDMKKVIGEENV
jgi:hypothetical protein